MIHKRHSLFNNHTGFTIAELTIVITVIAILAALIVVTYNGMAARSKKTTVQSDLITAVKLLNLYKTFNNSYPVTIDAEGCPATPVVDKTDCLPLSTGTTITYYQGSASGYSIREANSGYEYKASHSNNVPVAYNPSAEPPCQTITGVLDTGTELHLAISGEPCGEIQKIIEELYVDGPWDPGSSFYHADLYGWRCMTEYTGTPTSVASNEVVVPSPMPQTGFTSYSNVDCSGYLGDVQTRYYLVNANGRSQPFIQNGFWD